MSAGTIARPWRRFVRFSVRGLIVLVLVIGGWLGWVVRGARIQREAVVAILSAGGSVKYDWEGTIEGFVPEGKLFAPRWLVDLIGVDYFGHVISVSLFGSSTASDSTLALVENLTRLRELELSRSSVNDAGLAHLKALSELSWLYLAGTQVTDAGLAQLSGLTNLEVLDLSRTQVSDAGLTQLKGLNKLSTIAVGRTQVTDVGINELQQALPSLTIRH